MAIQLIGAGLGRTGTHSLKLALEQLLGGRCHHMMEVEEDQATTWRDAYLGEPPDWARFLEPYCAIVDWPGAGLWPELVEAFPKAPVLLSTRESSDGWYESANNTIFKAIDAIPVEEAGTQAPFLDAMMASFCPDWQRAEAIKQAYEDHNAAVRAAVPADRLFEYRPGDGWGPLCAALGVGEPDEPFPHTNTTSQFQARMERRSRGGDGSDR